MALAERVGLPGLLAEHVRPGGGCGVNADLKVGCLVAGMTAGADSIDDMGLLRHGAMDVLFGGVRARQRERDPHQRERADHARRGGDADTELAGKGGDGRRHDPVAERHGERHRGQDRRLARQASERATSGA